MKKQQNGAKPFFTQFLESQEQKQEEQLSTEEQKRLVGKGTLKYPSDRDESVGTQKYPSDSDEAN